MFEQENLATSKHESPPSSEEGGKKNCIIFPDPRDASEADNIRHVRANRAVLT